MFMETKQYMWAQWRGGDALQQWWQRQWVTSTSADIYERGMQTLVHCWQKCIANGDDYAEKIYSVAENLLYQTKLLRS